jgi:hypothetical protein
MQNEPEIRRMLLDLHRDEYQIQSTRITYWITLQYATYTIVAIGVGFLVQVFSNIHLLTLALIGTLLGQVFVLAMIHVNQEMFTSVVYIKQRLKPRVGHLVGQDVSQEFWEFEDLLAVERKTNLVAGFEAHYVLPVIFALVVMLGSASVLWASLKGSDSWHKIHFFWSFCNACVFALVIAKLPIFFKLQRAALGEYDRFALHKSKETKRVISEHSEDAQKSSPAPQKQ